MPVDRRMLTSTEAGDLVGGGPALRELVRTGRLNGYRPFGGTTLRSMLFRQEEIEAARAAAEAEKVATIYVVGFDQYVKIGFSLNPRKRLLQLQDRLPVDLQQYATFPGTMTDERALHTRFASLRLRGEWFRRSGRLRAWIVAGCPADGGADAP